jgi:hypothetical protein
VRDNRPTPSACSSLCFRKVKLAAYWGRVAVDPKELPLRERDEEDLRAVDWPPSRYDDPGALTVKRE